MRKEMLSTLAELLCRLRPELTLNVDDLNDDIRLREDLGIDSVTMLMLALAIERQFGFRFESVTADQMKTLGLVCDYIETRMNK